MDAADGCDLLGWHSSLAVIRAGNEASRAELGSARFGSASERAELGSARYFCEPENQARLGSVEAREPARAGSRATLNNVN